MNELPSKDVNAAAKMHKAPNHLLRKTHIPLLIRMCINNLPWKIFISAATDAQNPPAN
jgi:hypothetical protein